MNRMNKRIDDNYITEKIEAYNVAIDALRMHESADKDCEALAFRLRERLASKLDKEIQRWVNQRTKWSVEHHHRIQMTT